jgi:hypothetical protein
LIEENEEYDVISENLKFSKSYSKLLQFSPEYRESIQSRHLNNKCENIVNESVEKFVCHLAPWQMSDGLHFVVDE